MTGNFTTFYNEAVERATRGIEVLGETLTGGPPARRVLGILELGLIFDACTANGEAYWNYRDKMAGDFEKSTGEALRLGMICARDAHERARLLAASFLGSRFDGPVQIDLTIQRGTVAQVGRAIDLCIPFFPARGTPRIGDMIGEIAAYKKAIDSFLAPHSFDQIMRDNALEDEVEGVASSLQASSEIQAHNEMAYAHAASESAVAALRFYFLCDRFAEQSGSQSKMVLRVAEHMIGGASDMADSARACAEAVYTSELTGLPCFTGPRFRRT